MTPEHVVRLVAMWVRFYTRGLPPQVAGRRVEELDADLHDHLEHERAHGAAERRIVLGLAARALRGMAADLSWRSRTVARDPARGRRSMLRRPAARIALVTASVLLANLVAMLVTNEVRWGVFDFVFAGALLGGTGLLLTCAVARRGGPVPRAAAVTTGVAAIVLGEADDAPGLVGFGCLLVLGMVVLTVRDVRLGHR